MLFNQDEWQRYQRQISAADFGTEGQLKLKRSKVAVVGVGGLGSPVAMYLAAVGVGQITLIDNDVVSKSNLHRQVLYRDVDVGQPKVAVAALQLKTINPNVRVCAIHARFDPDIKHEGLSEADLILDCTDNFSARNAINDYCLRNRVAWLFASVADNQGQLCLFRPGGPCYRCLFPKPPAVQNNCNTQGIVGTVPGAMGLIQAQQCIHLLSGQDSGCEGVLRQINFHTLQTTHLNLTADPHCHCQTGDAPGPEPHESPATQDSPYALTPEQFVSRLQSTQHPLLIDARTEEEHKAFNIGGIQLCWDDCVQLTETARFDGCFVYCQSGKRSAELAARLRQHIAAEIYELQGGLEQLLPYMDQQGICPI